MTGPLGRRVAEQGLLTGDGGMGSLLMEAGLGAGACPELYNVDRPDVVEQICRDYCEAGAQLLQTNSFGASPAKLSGYGLAERCEELNRAAAAIARRAAGADVLVIGSIGPTGQLLEPFGPLSAVEALEGFRRQARALAEGGVDLLCVETMTDLEEAKLAVTAACETGLEVIATMTFDATPDGPHTIMGNPAAQCATVLVEAGAAAVGTNCGTGPETMIGFVRALRSAVDAPLLVQPNAGLPELRAGEVCYPESPGSMAGFVERLVEAGATIVGGCCGTTPRHIRAIRREIDRLRTTRWPRAVH